MSPCRSCHRKLAAVCFPDRPCWRKCSCVWVVTDHSRSALQPEFGACATGRPSPVTTMPGCPSRSAMDPTGRATKSISSAVDLPGGDGQRTLPGPSLRVRITMEGPVHDAVLTHGPGRLRPTRPAAAGLSAGSWLIDKISRRLESSKHVTDYQLKAVRWRRNIPARKLAVAKGLEVGDARTRQIRRARRTGRYRLAGAGGARPWLPAAAH